MTIISHEERFFAQETSDGSKASSNPSKNFMLTFRVEHFVSVLAEENPIKDKKDSQKKRIMRKSREVSA